MQMGKCLTWEDHWAASWKNFTSSHSTPSMRTAGTRAPDPPAGGQQRASLRRAQDPPRPRRPQALGGRGPSGQDFLPLPSEPPTATSRWRRGRWASHLLPSRFCRRWETPPMGPAGPSPRTEDRPPPAPSVAGRASRGSDGLFLLLLLLQRRRAAENSLLSMERPPHTRPHSSVAPPHGGRLSCPPAPAEPAGGGEGRPAHPAACSAGAWPCR